MARQLSTALSDFVLALSVLHFIYNVFWENFFAALGLSIQGMAAVLGVYRYVMLDPDPSVVDYHNMMSWLAHIVGVPLLGVGFAHNDIPIMVNLNFLFVIGTVVASRFVDEGLQSLLNDAASGFGILTIVLACLHRLNVFGLIGAAAYICSGLIIGSHGTLRGMPRIDILHYVLTIGNILFEMALI